ncbi:S-adenosyl-L-methionine-dependent methyltransferase [Xylaria grammica]|nr:S-adenosyl-L-methionine-dependent methyltransferase [Xylaria grammica]
MQTSVLSGLANAISASIINIQRVLSAKGISSPSLGEDALLNLPLEVARDYDIVLDATAELYDLLLELLNLIHRHGGHNNLVSLGAIAEFKIADTVPPNGCMSFREIADQTPLTEQMTTRLLRHAITMRVFREPEPGMVAHTAASKVLSHSAASDWLQSGAREMWPAATKTIEALKKRPALQEPNETRRVQGYSLSNERGETLYDIFAKDAERATRWERGMAIFSQRSQFDLSEFGKLSLTTQDLVKVDGVTIPERLRNRVQLTTHDLFSTRSCKGADVYSLRWKEKNIRATDINMAAAFDAQERTVAELKALFQDADLAFTLWTLIEPAGSAWGSWNLYGTGRSRKT